MYLLSGSSDKTIFVWEINNSYKFFDKLEGHSEAITSLAVLDKGVASASADKTIKIWSLSFKEDAVKELAHDYPILTICVLNNGLIATGSYAEIKIWKKVENKSEGCLRWLIL